MLRIWSSALAMVVLVAGTGMASAQVAEHCVVMLVPTAETGDARGAADPVDGGCYRTYAEAIEVGSAGAVALPATITPEALTQSRLDAATELDGGSVLIGTEWVQTGYSSSSQSYFASATCNAGTIWEVSNLGAFNDDFESGKGFGGCDDNKKFKSASFGGDVRTCSPDCWGYGDLNNAVSSLRWRP